MQPSKYICRSCGRETVSFSCVCDKKARENPWVKIKEDSKNKK